MSKEHISLTATIPEEMQGLRLDQALAKLFPDYSRARLQAWVKAEQVHVDGQVFKVKDKVNADQKITIEAELAVESQATPKQISLDIIYEDEDLLVINKPAGLVVHPGAGNPNNTLLNALLFHTPASVHLPRAGIVHRLDKETSGLLVVARTLKAHTSLAEQIQSRQIKRQYLAVVNGIIISGGTIEAAISRHTHQRTKMAVMENGKPAITHYRVLERFRVHTALQVFLETGRTHQIRVHMAHIHHPLIGDPTYGGRLRLPPDTTEAFRKTLEHFKRQALHAEKLTLMHPSTKEEMTFEAPVPEDLERLLRCLREDS